MPTSEVTILTRGDGEAGTTLSGNVLDEVGQESPFAGHASEVSNTQIVGVTGFQLLDNLYDENTPPKCANEVLDGDTKGSVSLAEPC